MFVSEDLITSAIANWQKKKWRYDRHRRADGKKLSLIDSVALSEDELVLLYEKRALI